MKEFNIRPKINVNDVLCNGEIVGSRSLDYNIGDSVFVESEENTNSCVVKTEITTIIGPKEFRAKIVSECVLNNCKQGEIVKLFL